MCILNGNVQGKRQNVINVATYMYVDPIFGYIVVF